MSRTELHVYFTEKEQEAIKQFTLSHSCEKIEHVRKHGGGFGTTATVGFIIMETMIGNCTSIFCTYCKEEIDITDDEAW